MKSNPNLRGIISQKEKGQKGTVGRKGRTEPNNKAKKQVALFHQPFIKRKFLHCVDFNPGEIRMLGINQVIIFLGNDS